MQARPITGGGQYSRLGVLHGKTESGVLQHFKVVTAVAERQHLTVFNAVNPLDSLQPIGFMVAWDHQLHRAVSNGNRLHYFAQMRLHMRHYPRSFSCGTSSANLKMGSLTSA